MFSISPRSTSLNSSSAAKTSRLTGYSENEDEEISTFGTIDSRLTAESTQSDPHSTEDVAYLSQSSHDSSTKYSDTSASETLLVDDLTEVNGSPKESLPKTASNTDSFFRRRSPSLGPGGKPPSGRCVSSLTNFFSLTPRFHRFEEEQNRPVGTIREIPSEDEASVRATIEQDRFSNGSDTRTPTKSYALHQVCLSASDPEELWRNISLVTPSSSGTPDALGRHPLHCLSFNNALTRNLVFAAQGNINRNEHSQKLESVPINPARLTSSATDRIRDFATQVLVQAHPASMISTDVSGYIPFEAALVEWVNQMTASPTDDWQYDTPHSSDRFASLWTKSIKKVGRQLSSARSIGTNTSAIPNLSPRSDIESVRPLSSQCGGLQQKLASNHRLTAAPFFAIQMLSDILDYLGRRYKVSGSEYCRPRSSMNTTDTTSLSVESQSESRAISVEIIRKIASIPRLLDVVLLLDDDNQRNYILSSTIMKCVLASRHSIGDWLTKMLQSREKWVIDRGVEYLHIVSNTAYSGDDQVSHRRSLENDWYDQKAVDPREELAAAISNLDGFVPSLVSLNERHVEEAATTQVVQLVLDKTMSRPFCVTIVFSDALFLATLITGFRLAVNSLVVGKNPRDVLLYIYIADIGLFYFLIRELGKGKFSSFYVLPIVKVHLNSLKHFRNDSCESTLNHEEGPLIHHKFLECHGSTINRTDTSECHRHSKRLEQE